MEQLTVNLIEKTQVDSTGNQRTNPTEVRLVVGTNDTHYIFHRNQLFSQYHKSDIYARNIAIVQLYLCFKLPQKILAEVFQLTIQHLSTLINKYRQAGSAGIQNRTDIRIGNNQKIKGKIADEIIKQLDVNEENRPSYISIVKLIKQKHGVQLSPQRISGWWKDFNQEKMDVTDSAVISDQIKLAITETQQSVVTEKEDALKNENEQTDKEEVLENKATTENDSTVNSDWQPNMIAGSFILYAMLNASQFLTVFSKNLINKAATCSKTVERVMLTLFFSHALRLKSIEQTKHLNAAHFEPLVLGEFCRAQTLRYAIDDITAHKNFDKTITEHYQNNAKQTELGDEVYYTDGHFSCYYGKYPVPKGYDARKKQAARGRNTIYLHNSLGHNIVSFESPTNTSLSHDIVTLIDRMKTSYGDVTGKHLFFDRGGFSADCFKQLTKEKLVFTTYLKSRKKLGEVESHLFEEKKVTVQGEEMTNQIYEMERQSKVYGTLRIILFIGKRGKQIPVISTNLTMDAAELVARLQKRWIEENGFKYMSEHFGIDLLTTYETEEAPDKIMSRPNPKRKTSNKTIAESKILLKAMKEQYANKLEAVKDKNEVTIAAFEENEKTLKLEIQHEEVRLGLLQLERKDIPSKIETNMKDESVITCQKRRMFINLIKTMNYNCEKWLQIRFCQHHPKADETLSLIRHVLKIPGRIRQRGQTLEVELERLDNGVQAKTLDEVLKKLKEDSCLQLPDGRKLSIWQASQ